MKKSLFFVAAASALMLTACSSENDVVQSPTNQNTVAVQQQELGFDVYTSSATNARRAGRVNVMTNETLQMTGFGILGYQTDNAGYVAGLTPNYMWNQQINWNNTNLGWYYAPLKYWPNETLNDSQEAGMPTSPTGTNIDKLSFFAYAPWVSVNASTGKASRLNTDKEAPGASVGIVELTKNDGTLGTASAANPKLKYVVANDPDWSVDLLWGVAPSGDLNYTAVNKTTVKVNAGMPLIDLIKPSVNTNMKFLFQHALARLGLKIILASDQIAAGGKFDFGNTKVTVEEIEITGDFGMNGILNLNNTLSGPNIARWESFETADGSDAAHKLVINSSNGLAEHLCYDATKNTGNAQQTHTGVTTNYSDVLQVSSIKDEEYKKYTYLVTSPVYNASTPFFGNATDNATRTYCAYSGWVPTTSSHKYFHKMVTSNPFTDNEAYTDITDEINVKYPNATYWEDIYDLANASTDLHQIADATEKTTYAAKTAYRLVGKTYTPTGQKVEIGDWVFVNDPVALDPPTLAAATTRYMALPNYFMVIPTNNQTVPGKKIKVKINYWVSTTDASLNKGIVYTNNVVEKEIEMPDIANGKAYTLKLILGMNSVKLEAEVEEWKNANADINLPQNTGE